MRLRAGMCEQDQRPLANTVRLPRTRRNSTRRCLQTSSCTPRPALASRACPLQQITTANRGACEELRSPWWQHAETNCTRTHPRLSKQTTTSRLFRVPGFPAVGIAESAEGAPQPPPRPPLSDPNPPLLATVSTLLNHGTQKAWTQQPPPPPPPPPPRTTNPLSTDADADR
jgi:hypothetical protein